MGCCSGSGGAFWINRLLQLGKGWGFVVVVFPPFACIWVFISHSQKEELLCNLTYLFCFCEVNTPFPGDSPPKDFPCVGHTDLLCLWSCICKYLWVYLVVRLEDGRDFTQPNISVWTFIFVWTGCPGIKLDYFFLYCFFADLFQPGKFGLWSGYQ